jgi:drug/metabolite transporter (DMT)-like permease
MLSHLSSQTRGTLYCIFGVLILTPDSLLVRLTSTLPGMEIIFYKYLFMFVTLLLIVIHNEKANLVAELRSLGWLEWFAAGLWGVSNLAINLAFLNISIATVLVINAANCLFAALVGYLLMGEQLKYRTIFTILTRFGALIYIFVSQLSDANTNILGLFSALVASVTLGVYLVLLRYIEQTKG